jgi:hypothetical protein
VTYKDVVVMSPSEGTSELQRIDPVKHRTVGRPVPFKAAPTDLDPNADRAVELTALPPTLSTWEPDLSKHLDLKVPADGVPSDVVKSLDDWVTDLEANTLVRFDALDGKLKAKIPMPLKPDGLAEDGNVLWVACQSGFVQRVNEKTGKKIGSEIDTGPLTGEIAAQLDVAWAAGPSYLVRIENREGSSR